MIRLLSLIIATVVLFGCNCPFDKLFSCKNTEDCPKVKCDKKDAKDCKAKACPKAKDCKAKACPKAKDCKTDKCIMAKDCKAKNCPKAKDCPKAKACTKAKACPKAKVCPKATKVAAKKAAVPSKKATVKKAAVPAKKATVKKAVAPKKAVVPAKKAAAPAKKVAPKKVIKATVTQNSKTGVYKVGEEIIFNIALTPAENKVRKNRKLTIGCYGDSKTFKTRTVTLDKDGKATITYKATKPGYYRIYEGSYKLSAGAIVDPYKIQAARPMPKDFNSYWDKLIATLKKTPLKPVLTPVKSPVKNMVAFDLQLPCPISKANVSGYFSKPAKAAPKSLPAILYVHGAGVVSASIPYVGNKALALNINAHGIKNGQPKAFYANLYKTTLKNYWHTGMDSRDTVYFRDMALRVYRALQFLKAQPEWNQKVLVVYGGSQGGAQGLMAAGLDPQVSAAVVNVPAVCDHGGASIGRESGWPRFSSTKIYNSNPKKYLPILDYVDCVNFARRIKTAKIFMTTGTIDTTCVPSSVCSAFNAIPSKNKELAITLNMTHAPTKAIYAKCNKFVHTELDKK